MVVTALLWYINTFFGRGVYSVLLEGEECFERSRAYALSRSTSTRDVEDLASVLALCALNGLCAVGLVVHGREALAGLDYADLLDAPPVGAALPHREPHSHRPFGSAGSVFTPRSPIFFISF
jgi:hypothetical protein